MRNLFLSLIFMLLVVPAFAQSNTQGELKTEEGAPEEIVPLPVITEKDTTVYDQAKINEQAEYVGGFNEFAKYLKENIKYPKEAVEKGIEGKVYISFVVEKDGSLSQIQLKRRVHPLLDEEAVRVLSNCPKWNPGTLDGKKVRSRFTLPISFRLPQDKSTDK